MRILIISEFEIVIIIIIDQFKAVKYGLFEPLIILIIKCAA